MASSGIGVLLAGQMTDDGAKAYTLAAVATGPLTRSITAFKIHCSVTCANNFVPGVIQHKLLQPVLAAGAVPSLVPFCLLYSASPSMLHTSNLSYNWLLSRRYKNPGLVMRQPHVLIYIHTSTAIAIDVCILVRDAQLLLQAVHTAQKAQLHLKPR